MPFALALVALAAVVLFLVERGNDGGAPASGDDSEPGANADENEANVIAESALHALSDVAAAPPFPVSPVAPGTRVSQGFSNSHSAIDFAMPVGSELFACADGVVRRVNLNPLDESGIFIIVRGRGAWSQIEWSYSHMTRVDVDVDQEVNAGDIVGASGDTGHSTGPHCHFAVLTANDNFLDPRPFLALVAPEVLA